MLLFLILLNPPFCYTLGKQGVQSLFSPKLSSSSQSKILGFGGLEEGGGAVLYFRIVPDVRKLSITAVRAARESLYFSETDRILATSSLICSQLSCTWLCLSLGGLVKGTTAFYYNIDNGGIASTLSLDFCALLLDNDFPRDVLTFIYLEDFTATQEWIQQFNFGCIYMCVYIHSLK